MKMELLVDGGKYLFNGVEDYEVGELFVRVKHSGGQFWFAPNKGYVVELKKGK